MPIKTWKIIDAAANVKAEQLSVTAKDVGGPAQGYSVKTHKLVGGLRDGVDTVVIDNGVCRFTVVPTRGMGIWKAWVGSLQIGWNSPVPGPVHPAFVPVTEPSGLGWLDGFDELLVRCGLYSNGAPDFTDKGVLTQPLHGRIANIPAHTVNLEIDTATGEITLIGIVDECRFHFQKLRLKTTLKTKPGEHGFRITDEITNLSGGAGTAQMLYHVNFGPPILDAGAKVVAPVKALVPRTAHAAKDVPTWDTFPHDQPGSEEQVYFFELLSDAAGQTQTLLKNAHGTQGVSLKFNTKQLPCFTLWKNTPAVEDGYVTGLEPGTNYPNPRAHETEQGRVLKLKAGETVRLELALEVHADVASVQAAESAVKKLAGNTPPKVFDAPQPGWCAGL